MEIQPIRYKALDLQMNPSILKQVSQEAKTKLYKLSDERNTIIIEYGSQTIKAGYQGGSKNPQIVFRPYVSKNRDPNRAEAPVKQMINTAYQQLDLQKITYKSAYERNIILHFSILEQCNDYIFAQMVRPNKQIHSPLIISQPFANPIHCRTSILEQFFECYQVDSVMIGVDTLFAYFYELGCSLNRYQKESALIIDMGATTTHVLAIIDGKIQWQSIRRINVGGTNAFELFGKTVTFKNPQLKNKLNYPFLKDIYDRFSSVAIDYKQQLNFFKQAFQVKKQNSSIYKNKIEQQNKQIDDILNLSLPIQIDFETIVQIPQEQLKRKQELKHRMAEKLKQSIARRKQMKRALQQKQLKDLQTLKQKYDQGDHQAHQDVAETFGQHRAHDKLLKKIKQLSIKLGLIQEKHQQKKFSLIDIPDNELPPQKLKFKKMQIYQKKAMEQRQKKIKQKQEEQQKMKDLRQNNPEQYLGLLRTKYHNLSKRIKQNQRMKSQLNNRKSKINQKRMQVLVKLAEDQLDQNFGQNQEDWDIYKNPQDSDHYSQMEVMEAQLRQIDPQWMQSKKDIHNLNSANQLFLKSELIKCNEIFFQPRLVGVNQNGIIDNIVSIIELYPKETQQKLLKNIYFVGGSCVIKGLKQRVQRDLRRQCCSDYQIKVNISQAGWKGAFLGMKNIARMHSQFIPKMSYQRDEYQDKNKNIYKIYAENPWSNPRPNV